MNYTPAKYIADRLVLNLRDYCERIEIAGSLRRQKENVGDIEICAMPKLEHQRDLFGNVYHTINLLEEECSYLQRQGQMLKNGQRYKQIALREGINLDLFLVLPPAQWGVIFTIRTGPPDFSQWIVTRRNLGGCLPNDCRVEDGVVYRGGRQLQRDNGAFTWLGGDPIPMPEERDFLDFLGLGCIAPWNRQARWPNS
jgi:DNA polymerase/3'-5' exonuclease PolX